MCGKIILRGLDVLPIFEFFQVFNKEIIIDRFRMIPIVRVSDRVGHVGKISIVIVMLEDRDRSSGSAIQQSLDER